MGTESQGIVPVRDGSARGARAYGERSKIWVGAEVAMQRKAATSGMENRIFQGDITLRAACISPKQNFKYQSVGITLVQAVAMSFDPGAKARYLFLYHKLSSGAKHCKGWHSLIAIYFMLDSWIKGSHVWQIY